MWYQIIQYLIFYYNSTNHHGVHSPFIFKLITECFYNKYKYDDYQTIKQYRSLLFQNHSEIKIKDFGAGSRIFKNNTRKISKIAKHAGISLKRAQLLYRITKHFKPDHILELGTSLGMATTALSLGNHDAEITSIEGCPETASIAKQQFENFKFNNINLIVNNFDDELKNLQNEKFDLIYIDGNHQKEATLSYFQSLLKTIHNDTILIFDDIHWSKGMTEAWENITQNEKVTVSIDTFFWGLVFFRKEQNKQHFVIRM